MRLFGWSVRQHAAFGVVIVEDGDGVARREVRIVLAQELAGVRELDLRACGIEHQDGVDVAQRDQDSPGLKNPGSRCAGKSRRR